METVIATEHQFAARVFLLDRRNRRFVLGLSSTTAEQKKILARIISVLCLSLLFGLLITSIYRDESTFGRHLRRVGHLTQGVVVERRTTSSGSGRDSCYITFQFQVPHSASGASVPRLIKNEVLVSDSVYDRIEKGQSISVIYDPFDPSISRPEEAIRSPVYPTRMIWLWWTGSAVILLSLFWWFWVERRFARKGILIKGTITELSRPRPGSDDDSVKLHYFFYSPGGRKFEDVVEKPAKSTNISGVSPAIGENDPVAVLYLADTIFRVLSTDLIRAQTNSLYAAPKGALKLFLPTQALRPGLP